MIKKLTITLIALITINGSLQSMQENNLIEFKGSKKYLYDWIKLSQSNNKHPFSVTLLACKTENGFIMKGDILKIDQQDLQDINDNNYVYCPFYGLQRTRLSKGSYQEVGILILGTKDEQACYELQLASLRSSKPKKNKRI